MMRNLTRPLVTLSLAAMLVPTLALGQFSSSTTKSEPLPPGQVAAMTAAMRYLELEAICRHTLTKSEADKLRLTGWDALVASGYEPKGATEALKVMDQLNSTRKPSDAVMCQRLYARAFD